MKTYEKPVAEFLKFTATEELLADDPVYDLNGGVIMNGSVINDPFDD